MTLDGGGADQYDAFYRGSGFCYDVDRERDFVQQVLIPVCGWSPGDRVIELGAGQGLHSSLLADAGMDVTAVEVSSAGVAAIRTAYPDLHVECADAATWCTDRPGNVYARGLSWYHYELGPGINQRGVDVEACTARVFRDLVAPGAVFAMQVVTDLTGRHPDTEADLTGDGPPDGQVHQSTLAEFEALFAPHGDVTVLDWSGDPFIPGQRHDRGVLVVTRKATR